MYSGFSSRKVEDKYNALLRDMLHTLSQIIISSLESTRLQAFRHTYHRIQHQLEKLDTQKYSDFKVSIELQPLTNHILFLDDLVKESVSDPPKRRKQSLRGKRSLLQPAKTLQNYAPKNIRLRSFSISMQKDRERQGPTMEELMKMNPLIERKMSGYRKKRFLNHQQNQPIREVDEDDRFD